MSQPNGIWNKWVKRSIDIAQLVGVFVAIAALVYTAKQIQENAQQIRESSNLASAQIGLRFDDRLNQPDMLAIEDDVEAIPQLPVLAGRHGNSTEDHLEQYLGDFDTIYYLHKQELINDPIVYDLFCGKIEYAIRDKEIIEYLTQERKLPKNATDDIGFDKLADLCISWEASGRGKSLEE